jgi:hypothetical protein
MASPLSVTVGFDSGYFGSQRFAVAAACSTILLRMRQVALNTTKIAGPDRPNEERTEEEHGVLSYRNPSIVGRRKQLQLQLQLQ